MRRGFTLVEVLVAVVLSGLVVLMAHRTWTVARDTTRAITMEQVRLQNRASLRRWLEEIVGSLDAGTPSAAGFRGTPTSLTGTAWITMPEGWREQVHVNLRTDLASLTCATDHGVLRLGQVAWWRLEYLLGTGPESRWYPEWESQVTLPNAVRIHLGPEDGAQAVDTVLVVLGRRG